MEAGLANQLLSLLEKEQSVLLSFQVDAMEHLLDEKFQLLNKLGGYTKKRYQALADNGFEANESGMKNWLKRNQEPTLLALWQDFQNTLSSSKEANRLNGLLVAKQFNRNQEILNTLNGSNSTHFYGPNGHASSNNSMRSGVVA